MGEFQLQDRVRQSLAWKGASQLVLQLSRFGLAIVLARLLTPHDFGLAAMVLAFATFIIPFADVGLGAALVQRPTLRPLDVVTVFWTSLAAGVTFTLAGIAASYPLARFYGEPSTQPLFAVLSLSFLITSLGATQRSLLAREVNFRSLQLRVLAATAVGIPVAVAVAANGYGAWTFVVFELVVASVSTVSLWLLSPWRPSLAYSFASLRRLGLFGGNTLGARVLFDLSQVADRLLIGRYLGAPALGLYALASNIVLSPFSRVVGPLQEVLFPAFSRVQENRSVLAEAWLRAIRIVSVVALPSLVGLAVVADDFVEVVLGEKWHKAVPLIQVLAWVGILQALQGLNASILQAVDRTTTLVRFALAAFGANLVAIIIGLRWGVAGVAVAFAISATALMPVYAWLTARALRLPLRAAAKAVAGVVEASALLLVVVLLLRFAVLEAGLPTAVRLVTLIAVGIAAFVPLCLWRAPELRVDLRALRRRTRPATESSDS